MSDISSNSGPFRALDEAIDHNTSALVVSFDKDGGLKSEKASWWMRTRSGLLRVVRWFGIDSKNFWLKPQDTNRESLNALLNYIKQQGGENAYRHVLKGTARLNGDTKEYTIADRLKRGSYVSSKLVKQMKDLAKKSPQMKDLAEESSPMQRRDMSILSRSHPSDVHSDEHDVIPPTDEQDKTQDVSDNEDIDEPSAGSHNHAPDLNTNEENQNFANPPSSAPVTPRTSQSAATMNSANDDDAEDPSSEAENSTSEHISNTNTHAKPTAHGGGDSEDINDDGGFDGTHLTGVTLVPNPRFGSTYLRQPSTDFDNLQNNGSHTDTKSSAPTTGPPSMLRPLREGASERPLTQRTNRSQPNRVEKNASGDDAQDMSWTMEITTFDFESAKTVALKHIGKLSRKEHIGKLSRKEQIGELSKKDKKAFDTALRNTIARIENKHKHKSNDNDNDERLQALRREVLKLVTAWWPKALPRS